MHVCAHTCMYRCMGVGGFACVPVCIRVYMCVDRWEDMRVHMCVCECIHGCADTCEQRQRQIPPVSTTESIQACATELQNHCWATRVRLEETTRQGRMGSPQKGKSGARDTPRPGQSLTFYGILEKWVQEGSWGAMIQPQPEKQNPETKSTAHISQIPHHSPGPRPPLPPRAF